MRISGQDQMESGIGIDVETDKDPNPKMARFFLKPNEIKKLKPAKWNQNLLRLWTVKEAIFKSDPLNMNTTLLDYEVSDPNALCGEAICEKSSFKFYYSTKKVVKGFLTVAITKEAFPC